MPEFNTAAAVVYRIAPPGRRRVLWGFFALAVFPVGLLLTGAITGEPTILGVAAVVALIMLPFCAYLIWYMRRQKLTLDAAGLEVTGALGRAPVRFAWDAIEALHLAPGREGLVLREPFDSPASRRLAGTAYISTGGVSIHDERQAEWIAQQRWIPFNAFAGWLQSGGLLADFRRFAPRLAEQAVAMEASVAQERRTARRTLIAVLAFSAAIVVTTILVQIYGVPSAFRLSLSPGTSAALDTAGRWLVVIGLVALLLVTLGTAIVNLRSCWRHLRERSWGYALLWLASGVTQLLLAVLVASWLFE